MGAGNLELPLCGSLGCIDPVEVLTVLKLVEEPTDSPELYDFRLGSGVVLEEEGVEALRGNIDGDRDDERISAVGSDGVVS